MTEKESRVFLVTSRPWRHSTSWVDFLKKRLLPLRSHIEFWWQSPIWPRRIFTGSFFYNIPLDEDKYRRDRRAVHARVMKPITEIARDELVTARSDFYIEEMEATKATS